jgi:hypothetical protein
VHSRLLEHEFGDRATERGVREGADVGHLPLAEAVGGRRGEAAEVPMVVGHQRRGALYLQAVGPGGGACSRRQGEAVGRDHAERDGEIAVFVVAGADRLA